VTQKHLFFGTEPFHCPGKIATSTWSRLKENSIGVRGDHD
jgi:hypothetical protein